uniref:DUF674 family protein n=1 Tax=Cajanus cajan TaxID=3821 RepID=A0A151UD09_CAJCA|nr:hypothetical protein KK1_021392 [Cajanus cajan]
MAEASGDFVDVLFSFLTLPLGTIILHESEDKFPHNQSVMIGCIKNLYQSVKDLSTDVFRNGICKRMLLSPRNALEASCQKLKVNVDNTLPTKYFMCNICSPESVSLLSAFEEATCSCGKSMDKEVELLVESKEKPEEPKYDGVFVKGDAMFLIFDDLKVLRSSPSDSLQLLLKHRHKDLSKINGMSKHVSTQKIFHILKQALTSESPLSDVLLENRESKPSYSFSPYTSPSHGKDCVKIKVIVSKSQNKVLFAEVDGDFVDFLVSFLTTPLGSILNLMDGKLSLGSIDNLYASVKDLDSSWFIGSSNKSLLNPKVAPQFGCRNNPLNALQEDNTPKYWYGTPVEKYNMENDEKKKISKKKEMLRDPPQEMKLFDPRSSVVGSDVHQKYEFMKRPCLFVVTDDLKVIPITTASSFPYPKELGNFKLDDVEEHMVKIRKKSHEVIFSYSQSPFDDLFFSSSTILV